jgi:hypothetical protein
MAAISVGVVVLLVALVIARRRRQHAIAAYHIGALIAANRPTFRQGFDVADEAVRLRTKTRRETADRLRARAAHVESGASSTALLQMVKRS